MKIIIISIIIAALVSVVVGDTALLLSPCDSDADCRAINGTCAKVAETCSRGVCICLEPYVPTDSGICRKGIPPWHTCNSQLGEVCTGHNFQCIDGQCQCRPGLFPVGETCVQMAQVVASLGSTCSDDSNCLPEMQCRPWISHGSKSNLDHIDVTICQCPTTHRVLNNTQCVPRRIGDPCGGSDADCGLILDAVCSLRTFRCACPATHKRTKTLFNLAPSSLKSAWRLLDACRPLNGATKVIGQRCTNSLQCQYGHVCARCEPKNLNAPKTCNRPLCSSSMCRNRTCPLCNHRKKATTTASITTAWLTTTTTITSSTESSTSAKPSTSSTASSSSSSTSETTKIQPLAFKAVETQASTTTLAPKTEASSGSNVALAVTLPLLILVICMGGMVLFVRYAWGKLDWRRAVKCVDAFETASSSASSGSTINPPFGDPSFNISEPLPAPTSMGLPNVSFFGGVGAPEDCSFTQASATLMMRQPVDCDDGDDEESTTYARSALTANFNSANGIDYSHKHSNTLRRDMDACPRHKYCFNSHTMEDMVDNRREAPKLPTRSKSIRTYVDSHWSGTRTNMVASHLDSDRRKSLQY